MIRIIYSEKVSWEKFNEKNLINRSEIEYYYSYIYKNYLLYKAFTTLFKLQS